jgi:hypothetical protein
MFVIPEIFNHEGYLRMSIWELRICLFVLLVQEVHFSGGLVERNIRFQAGNCRQVSCACRAELGGRSQVYLEEPRTPDVNRSQQRKTESGR